MRIASFRTDEGAGQRIGLVEGTAIVELKSLEGAGTVLQMIESGAGFDHLERIASYDIGEIELLAPIPRPVTNIICLGRNYATHAQEMAGGSDAEPERPTFFTKATTSVIGPRDGIPIDRQVSTMIDWEVELAVIIGRRARRVADHEAIGHVFGYMVLNDVSARDLQYGFGGQFFYGKSLDGSCPIGPWIVTPDEVPDPQRLDLELRLNGVTKQSANTSEMIFQVSEIIATLSRAMTLVPGQIIATGTPAGVGAARTPQEFLEVGDVVESEVKGIGMLRNPVIEAQV